MIIPTHKNFKNYYKYSISENESIGNTGGLMMIRTNLFKSTGGFNEGYISCFEDVELNLTLLIKGFKNITCGSLVAYHYESQTRKNDSDDLKKSSVDYNERLIKFISENLNKLKPHLTIIQ